MTSATHKPNIRGHRLNAICLAVALVSCCINGATFGCRQSVAGSLRVQHTSNGGLSETNPGIDMIGINVTFKFSDS